VIAVSIVSHGHGEMVSHLVAQLLRFPEVKKIIVTYNIEEREFVSSCDRVCVVVNDVPKGFGANHNAAFAYAESEYWCVLNPDVTFIENPFTGLLLALKMESIGIVAPLVINPRGDVEDSARHFPTAFSLSLKLIGYDRTRYAIDKGQPFFYPDWVAGMFMLFNARNFRLLDGFDERYFLYYEDVDICRRARRQGLKIVLCPKVSVIHDAQRASHRKLRYLRWHLKSLCRFLLT
jgi:N-acetylglucosaminyl-diphospho-decaprenol L-rhamnosyltransferase